MSAPETKLNVNEIGGQWVIELPAAAPDPVATVIKIGVQGMPKLAK